ncbi:calcium-activated potassium channel subunit beta-3 [Alosa sapidissima]|uniref:calcium-activated potassium channel subunit beta-3 n=1 Tax=Alosa sapidissima TaxID=34773 RepID=UPI001C0942D7|nr:calcium-activated potassium channel subunit beta-3 [Alosa sapidissima]
MDRRRWRTQLSATLYQGQTQEPRRKCGNCNEKAKPQTLLSTVGDERALLLGFTMMAFSILMYFVVGIVVVKPHLQSDWGEEVNCTLTQAYILEEWSDCRGLTTFPCLQVLVNISVNVSSSQIKARLHYDEKSINLNPECFYTPKCQRNESDLLQEARKIKQYLDARCGEVLRCRFSAWRYSEDAILYRKCNRWLTLWYLLWPSLMLGGGMLLVSLLKLNQRLAHLCTELDGEEAWGTQTALVNGRLYQLLSWRRAGSGFSPQEESTGRGLSYSLPQTQGH